MLEIKIKSIFHRVISICKSKVQGLFGLVKGGWKSTRRQNGWALLALCLFSLATATGILIFKADFNPPIDTAVVLAQTKANSQPQVLGESTQVTRQPRGRPNSPSIPILTVPVDDSTISAQSYLVADAQTGTVLAKKNADQQFEIGSLTKLMTAFIVYGNDNLQSTITVTPADHLPVSPALDMETGDQVSISDVFNAMLIGSDNDAALALANHLEASTGKNFISLMNEKAQALGMTNTHYANPIGFDDPENYSTADDLLKLVTVTEQLAAFTSLGRKTSYSFSGSDNIQYGTTATNTLLKTHPEIQAIKTGTTDEAGDAMISAAAENGHQILIIVLKSTNRNADTLNLEQQVFKKAQWE